MKKLVLFALFVLSISAFGQDVKLKKGTISVDDKEWAKYDGCGMFDAECTFFKGELEINLQANVINDPTKIERANPEGRVFWYEVKFLGTNKSFEIQQTAKNVAKTLYKANVVNEDGTFNEDAIDKIIEKYGFQFSERYNRSQPTQTIIIQDQRPKNGVNISIGR